MVCILHVSMTSDLFYIHEVCIHICILCMNVYMYLHACILGCIYLSYLFLYFFVFRGGFVSLIH